MKQFSMIFLAVMLANFCSLVLYESYQLVMRQEQTKVTERETAAANEQMKAIIEESTEKQTKQVSQDRRQAELLSSAENLCNYWSKTYDKEPTGLNEALRDKACARHKKLLAAMPSEE